MPPSPPPAPDPPASTEPLAPADETLGALVEIGPREAGSAALARARSWANARLAADGRAEPPAPAAFVLAARLDTDVAGGAALVEQSSGAAAVLDAARALAQADPPVAFAVALLEGVPGSPEWRAALGPPGRAAAAELVVYVGRACGLPARRDLLSHRVLRERFFQAAGASPPPGAFERAEAPHAELAAEGARRIVAIDAPAGSGVCSASTAGDALARFIRDASALLSPSRQGVGHRGERPLGSNAAQAAAS